MARYLRDNKSNVEEIAGYRHKRERKDKAEDSKTKKYMVRFRT